MSDGTDEGSGGPPTVVVTASRFPHGYASVRSLGRRDVRTIAAVEDETLPVTASRYCDEVVEVPPSNDLYAYREALSELARRDDVETIVPHRPQDVYVLSRHREEFDEHVDVVVPEFDTLRDVHDRLRLAEAAERAGVAVPGTAPVEEVDRDDYRIVRSRYTLLVDEYVDCVPPGEARVPASVEVVAPGESPDVRALEGAVAPEPIAQEFAPTDDVYLFAALYHRGTALATFHQRTIRADSCVGHGVYRETVREPDLEAAGRALLDELEWHGPACARFVRNDHTDALEVVDVVPRMWESLPVAVRSGADFPQWYLLHARRAVEEIRPDYEVGVESHFLSGELEHLRSVLADGSARGDRPSFPDAAWRVLVSCARSRNFDYVHPDDPSPAIRQLRNGFSRAVGLRR